VRVVLVHERALTALRACLPALERGDVGAHKTHLLRAIRAIRLAPLLIDTRRGGALAQDLVSLYAHMGARLGDANLHADAAPIREVIELVELLLAGWRAAAESASPTTPASEAKPQLRKAVRA
jgi:flagellar biosynthetic protein FliS